MIAGRNPPKTVFDVPPDEHARYQTLLAHLTDIGMEIARHFRSPPGIELEPTLLDKLDAFARAIEVVLVTIRLSDALKRLRGRNRRELRVSRQRLRSRARDAEDVLLYRPISAVIREVCIDLATAASALDIPPWLATTPDSLRSLIVAVARREAERLEAAGEMPPTPFSAEILHYRPRAAGD